MANVSDHRLADELAGLAVSAQPFGGALATARAGFRGWLPPRYLGDAWARRFDAEVAGSLFDGIDGAPEGA